MEKDVIILSRMYAGKYLESKDNIGHEVINLFKADNGNNYIYANKDGRINPKYNDRVKAVILVRYVEKGVMEVIAKATCLEQVLRRAKDKNTDSENQIKYIKDNDIRYGGVLLSDVYKHSNEKVVITFSAAFVKKPKLPLYLYEGSENKSFNSNENGIYLPDPHFSSQSLIMYYDKNNPQQARDYDVLSEMLHDDSLWEFENTTDKINIDDYKDIHHKKRFLELVGKQYDELIFSRLFEYIFESNKTLFSAFAKEVLKIRSFDPKFSIEREDATDSRSRIDLRIENSETVIIIENKIKAKINSVKHDERSEDGRYKSQLSEYYNAVRNSTPDKALFCYVFSPDYNAISLENYINGNQYTVIKYSQIYDFYYKHAGAMLDTDYFIEFLETLALHTNTVDNSNFENMKNRFISKIKKIREVQPY